MSAVFFAVFLPLDGVASAHMGTFTPFRARCSNKNLTWNKTKHLLGTWKQPRLALRGSGAPFSKTIH